MDHETLSAPFIPSSSIAFTLPSLLSPHECQALIATATALSPTYVTSAKGADGVTVSIEHPNPHRVCVFDSGPFTQTHGEIFTRLMRNLPEGLLDDYISRPGYESRRTVGLPLRLNPRFRVLRYGVDEGDEFLPHLDATTVLPPSVGGGEEESAWTVLIYLNDGFNGGETAFLNPNSIFGGGDGSGWAGKGEIEGQSPPRSSHPIYKEDPSVRLGVKPTTGKVVIFEHGLLHSGEPVEPPSPTNRGDVKWILRTDIMFQRRQNTDTDADEKKEVESATGDPVVSFSPSSMSVIDFLASLNADEETNDRMYTTFTDLSLIDGSLDAAKGVGAGALRCMLMENEISSDYTQLIVDQIFR